MGFFKWGGPTWGSRASPSLICTAHLSLSDNVVQYSQRSLMQHRASICSAESAPGADSDAPYNPASSRLTIVRGHPSPHRSEDLVSSSESQKRRPRSFVSWSTPLFAGGLEPADLPNTSPESKSSFRLGDQGARSPSLPRHLTANDVMTALASPVNESLNCEALSDDLLLPFVDRPSEIKHIFEHSPNQRVYSAIQDLFFSNEGSLLRFETLLVCPREEMNDEEWIGNMKRLILPESETIWQRFCGVVGIDLSLPSTPYSPSSYDNDGKRSLNTAAATTTTTASATTPLSPSSARPFFEKLPFGEDIITSPRAQHTLGLFSPPVSSAEKDSGEYFGGRSTISPSSTNSSLRNRTSLSGDYSGVDFMKSIGEESEETTEDDYQQAGRSSPSPSPSQPQSYEDPEKGTGSLKLECIGHPHMSTSVEVPAKIKSSEARQITTSPLASPALSTPLQQSSNLVGLVMSASYQSLPPQDGFSKDDDSDTASLSSTGGSNYRETTIPNPRLRFSFGSASHVSSAKLA